MRDILKSTHGSLTPKQERSIIALLSHQTIAEAAKASGVSESTLWRWLQQEDFQKRYRQAQRSVVDRALGQLQSAAESAVQTLTRNLTCGKPEAENRAAVAILEFNLKARELFEMEERLTRLEALLKEKGAAFGT